MLRLCLVLEEGLRQLQRRISIIPKGSGNSLLTGEVLPRGFWENQGLEILRHILHNVPTLVQEVLIPQ